MSKHVDKHVGWVDFYHGRKFHEGSESAPVFEGRVKATADIKKGEEIRFAVWPKVKEGVTKDEFFSGKLLKSVIE